MAKKRKTYHVTPTDDGWKATVAGGARASVTGKTKQEVQDEAIRLAKKADLGQVVIHGRDGKIQGERTYGKDPYPPKG